MLVLSRRPGEEIVIGDSIRITVAGVQGDKVRLGISAPDDIPVHRSEVYDRIREFGPPAEATQNRIRT
jgi:carbon storage regulator